MVKMFVYYAQEEVIKYRKSNKDIKSPIITSIHMLAALYHTK